MYFSSLLSLSKKSDKNKVMYLTIKSNPLIVYYAKMVISSRRHDENQTLLICDSIYRKRVIFKVCVDQFNDRHVIFKFCVAQ